MACETGLGVLDPIFFISGFPGATSGGLILKLISSGPSIVPRFTTGACFFISLGLTVASRFNVVTGSWSNSDDSIPHDAFDNPVVDVVAECSGSSYTLVTYLL